MADVTREARGAGRAGRRVARLNIRALGPDDLQQYRALRLRALHDDPTAFSSSYEEESARPLEYFARRLAPGRARSLFGSFVDDMLIGMAGVRRATTAKERHEAVITSVFVALEHRGRGVGRQLLAHALARATAMPGVRQVTLAVTAGNSAAVALYETFGFRSYGRAPDALFVDGSYHDEILMVRMADAE